MRKTNAIEMENHGNHHAPVLNMVISLISTILTWITFYGAQYALSFCLTCIGIVSGIFAIRYYYYAGNEKRDKIKRNNESH